VSDDAKPTDDDIKIANLTKEITDLKSKFSDLHGALAQAQSDRNFYLQTVQTMNKLASGK
jgi:hypothetical protein